MSEKPITGYHVFFATAAAFSVIIGVNVFMAVQAVSTFPGLEVKNSYVASQTFNETRDAQIALGWDVDAEIRDGVLMLSMLDADGLPAEVRSLTGTLGRPTHVLDDLSPAFERTGGVFQAPVEIGPGAWALRIEAIAPDGTVYRKRFSLYVGS